MVAYLVIYAMESDHNPTNIVRYLEINIFGK